MFEEAGGVGEGEDAGGLGAGVADVERAAVAFVAGVGVEQRVDAGRSAEGDGRGSSTGRTFPLAARGYAPARAERQRAASGVVARDRAPDRVARRGGRHGRGVRYGGGLAMSRSFLMAQDLLLLRG
jgi:hypothetical protein